MTTLFASCGKDSQDEPLPGEGDIAVHFSTGVSASVSVTETVNTRAVVTTTLPGNSTVGVYGVIAVTGGDTASYNMKNTAVTFQENLSNTPYTVLPEGTDPYGNQTLYYEKTAKFPKGNKAALAFYAYYPYSARAERREDLGMCIPWTINKADMSKTEDYMYTGRLFSGVSKIPIKLKLNHAMARLDFTFYTEDMDVMNSEPYLTQIEVDAFGAETGWMSLEDGELDYQNTLITYTFPVDSKLISINNRTVYASFLLPPSTVVSRVRYTVRNNLGTNSYEVYSAVNDKPIVISLAAGKTTKVNVNYFPKEVQAVVGVKAWELLKSYDINVKLK